MTSFPAAMQLMTPLPLAAYLSRRSTVKAGLPCSISESLESSSVESDKPRKIAGKFYFEEEFVSDHRGNLHRLIISTVCLRSGKFWKRTVLLRGCPIRFATANRCQPNGSLLFKLLTTGSTDPLWLVNT